MLCFGHRRGQTTVISVPPSEQPTEIVLKVYSIEQDEYGLIAKIGFDAPREVAIDREEVARRKRRDGHVAKSYRR